MSKLDGIITEAVQVALVDDKDRGLAIDRLEPRLAVLYIKE